MLALLAPEPTEGLVPEEVKGLADKVVSLGFEKTDPQQWLAAGSAFIGIWVLLSLVHAGLRSRFRKLAESSDRHLAEVAYDVVSGTRWYFHATVALLLALRFVRFTELAA